MPSMISSNCSFGRLNRLLTAFSASPTGCVGWPLGDALDFLAPPAQLGGGERNVVAFVDHVIDFTAKSVKRHDRAPALGGQEQEAVVEGGAAGRALLLTILVGTHGVTL